MSSIKVNIRGAERLGEIFDITVEEINEARNAGVPVSLSQERGVFEGAIILTIATIVEPFVKEFLMKFLGRIAQNLADRLMSPQPVESFVITVNDTHYRLPDDLERLRQEQNLG